MKRKSIATDDFRRSRLSGMIDPRHRQPVPPDHMPLLRIEATLAATLSRKDLQSKVPPVRDLVATTQEVAGASVSATSRLQLPIRLVATLTA